MVSDENKLVTVGDAGEVKRLTTELIRCESNPPLIVDMIQLENPSVMSDSMNQNLLEMKDEMTTSVTKVRINTEEEAKAALAERRRLAREEAERQAEQEKLRIELEAQQEIERQRREEEQIQRLVEQQRIAEQERLEEVIFNYFYCGFYINFGLTGYQRN